MVERRTKETAVSTSHVGKLDLLALRPCRRSVRLKVLRVVRVPVHLVRRHRATSPPREGISIARVGWKEGGEREAISFSIDVLVNVVVRERVRVRALAEKTLLRQ